MPLRHEEDDDEDAQMSKRATLEDIEREENGEEDEEDAEDLVLGDGEHHTVKAIQEIWKPALYKKNRSIEAKTYNALHSVPGEEPSIRLYLSIGNILWALLFGIPIGALYLILSVCYFMPLGFVGRLGLWFSSRWTESNLCCFFKGLEDQLDYANLLLQLALYCFWPFGRFIAKRKTHSTSSKSDNRLCDHHSSAGSPLSSPMPRDSTVVNMPEEQKPLLGDHRTNDSSMAAEDTTNDSFINTWSSKIASILFSIPFFALLAPVHLLVSGVCFFMVVSVPMAKLNYMLVKHLYRHPLRLSVHTPENTRSVSALNSLVSGHYTSNTQAAIRPLHIMQHPNCSCSNLTSQLPADMHIVLCIHHAMGVQYFKYTVDGVNILFINFLALVFFCILNFYVIGPRNGYTGISSKSLIFVSGLVSVVPLAYFIGAAVSSITAQTGSLALGAVINATFGSVIEVLLYSFALMEGKARMVEGAIIGSFLCGLLALPGASMFSGGLVKKEQSFNAKSAGITSTMLIMALIGAFTPTIFHELYGTFELECYECPSDHPKSIIGCRKCRYTQPHPTKDPIYGERTKPLMYVCASALVLTYAIGLLFTLRTHQKRIYSATSTSDLDINRPARRVSKKRTELKDSVLSPQQPQTNLDSSGSGPSRMRRRQINSKFSSGVYLQSPMLNAGPPVDPKGSSRKTTQLRNNQRDGSFSDSDGEDEKMPTIDLDDDDTDQEPPIRGAQHDHPNWGAIKSVIVLLFSTVLFSIIAEILVSCVDSVLKTVKVDEKFLGLTLFSIIPSVTEFYNAIAFAMQENIVLSLEIGSAYTIQVALLQIPALVAFSAWYLPNIPSTTEVLTHPFQRIMALFEVSQGITTEIQGFTLVFPRFDFYAVIISTFILTYIYIEGKSNYFKGSILLLAYFVLVTGFYFSPSDLAI